MGFRVLLLPHLWPLSYHDLPLLPPDDSASPPHTQAVVLLQAETSSVNWKAFIWSDPGGTFSTPLATFCKSKCFSGSIGDFTTVKPATLGSSGMWLWPLGWGVHHQIARGLECRPRLSVECLSDVCLLRVHVTGGQFNKTISSLSPREAQLGSGKRHSQEVLSSSDIPSSDAPHFESQLCPTASALRTLMCHGGGGNRKH